jgi:predicted CXXCH cytochrome family protein
VPVSRPLAWLLLVLATVFGGSYWLLAAPLAEDWHPRDMQCPTCHLSGSEVRPEQAGLLLASQEVLCGKCHPGALQVSHPSGIKPRMPLPAAYPLDWKGDMTCSTCHNVHAIGKGKMRGKLRRREFCTACHDKNFFDSLRDGGVSMLLSGHLESGIEMDSGGLDKYSLQCLDCHGNAGESNQVGVKQGVLRHVSGAVNHPIGVTYADYEQSGSFRPQQRLTKKILLPGGKVSCVSCHDGYSTPHGRLVMPNRGSALCFECHDI